MAPARPERRPAPAPDDAPDGDDALRDAAFLDHADRLLVREVLALSPAERLDTLRVVDELFARARRVE